MKNDEKTLVGDDAHGGRDDLGTSGEGQLSHDDPFKAEFLGRWASDPQLEQAVGLWRAYYDECEMFDRGVCSGMRNGSAIPVTSWESAEINRNASRVYGILRNRLREASIPDAVSERAKRIALDQHDGALKRRATATE